MLRQLIRPPLLGLLTILAVAACGDHGGITSVMQAPSAMAPAVANLVRGQLEADVPYAWAIIGPEGGTLELRGHPVPGEASPRSHTLTVPAGTVAKQTVFVMLLDDTSIAVELRAYDLATGQEIKKFKQPLTLGLTYAFAKGKLDPSRLGIVYVVGNDIKERIPSRVDVQGKTVYGTIWHFSRYAAEAE